jgi:hypothetical protein
MRVALGITALSLVTTESQADQFVLTTGASLCGQLLNRNEPSSPFYLIATEHGCRVKLEHSQVVEVIRQSAAQIKYDRLAPSVADTVKDQWKLAQWCQDNDLPEQCEQHLLRVVELDPHHELARRALGYSEIGGQWVKQQKHLERKGYVRYKGMWRLPQAIELAERRQTLELATKKFTTRVLTSSSGARRPPWCGSSCWHSTAN